MELDRLPTDCQAARQEQKLDEVWLEALRCCIMIWTTTSFYLTWDHWHHICVLKTQKRKFALTFDTRKWEDKGRGKESARCCWRTLPRDSSQEVMLPFAGGREEMLRALLLIGHSALRVSSSVQTGWVQYSRLDCQLAFSAASVLSWRPHALTGLSLSVPSSTTVLQQLLSSSASPHTSSWEHLFPICCLCQWCSTEGHPGRRQWLKKKKKRNKGESREQRRLGTEHEGGRSKCTVLWSCNWQNCQDQTACSKTSVLRLSKRDQW